MLAGPEGSIRQRVLSPLKPLGKKALTVPLPLSTVRATPRPQYRTYKIYKENTIPVLKKLKKLKFLNKKLDHQRKTKSSPTKKALPSNFIVRVSAQSPQPSAFSQPRFISSKKATPSTTSVPPLSSHPSTSLCREKSSPASPSTSFPQPSIPLSRDPSPF